MNVIKTVVSCLLCVLIAGCGESQSERNKRMAAEARAKTEAQIKAAREAQEKAQAKAQAEAKAKYEAERKKAQEEAAKRRKEIEEENARRLAEIKRAQDAYNAELERKKPRSIYTLSVEQRRRFNKFGGIVIGEASNDVPDADPHNPVPYIKKVKLQESFDVFSNAYAEVVYTPVSKRAAYIKAVVEEHASKYDHSANKRLLKAFKKHYDVEFCIFDHAPFVIKKDEQVRYESSSEKLGDEKTCGYCNGVDDKVLSLNYSFDEEKQIARYTAYIINTNLCDAINIEAKELQENAIENDAKKLSRSLHSFCGVQMGKCYPELDNRWGTSGWIKHVTDYSKDRGESLRRCGENAPHSLVKCNAFRRFRPEALIHVSPTSKKLFKMEIESDNMKMAELERRNLWHTEFTNMMLTIESKYKVKPYKLVYGNKYRMSNTAALVQMEYLFVCGETFIFVQDVVAGDHKFILTCIDISASNMAMQEYQTLRQAMQTVGAEQLFDAEFDGLNLESFFGVRFGQPISCKPFTSVGQNSRAHAVTGLIPQDKIKTFRGLMGIPEVKATWSSKKIYSITLSSFGGCVWGHFYGKEECENIRDILSSKIKTLPDKEVTEYGVKYTFKLNGQRIIEMRVGSGYAIELEAKDLAIEKASLCEFDEDNKKLNANRMEGSSAL